MRLLLREGLESLIQDLVHPVFVGGRRLVYHVALEVCLTALPDQARKRLPQGLLESFVCIAGGHLYAGESSLFELVDEPLLGLPGLAEGYQKAPESPAVRPHRCRRPEARPSTGPPLAAGLPGAGAPKHQKGIVLIQRALGPGLNLLFEVLGKPRYGRARKFPPAKLGVIFFTRRVLTPCTTICIRVVTKAFSDR